MKIKNNRFLDYFVLPGFFVQILGVFWFTFIILGIHSLFKLTLKPIFENKRFFIPAAIYIAIKLFQGTNLNTFIFLKTYFGLYFFIFYFRYFNSAILEKILISLMSITIFGHFLIKGFSYTHEIQKLFFWKMAYPHPTAFGENTTISAGILVIFLINYYDNVQGWMKKILIADVVLCGSGLGFLGLIYFTILRKWKLIRQNNTKVIGVTFCAFFLYLLFYISLGNKIYTGSAFYKISPYYLKILLDLKIQMLTLEISSFKSLREIIFGIAWNGDHYNGGDFGWMQILRMTGVIGLFLNIYFMYDFIKDKRILYFVLFAIFHYNLIWWPAGQIYIGYVVGKKLNEQNIN